MLGCGCNHVVSTKNIVLDCLEDVALHERHMLVRRGVVDDGGLIFRDHFRYTGAVLDTSDLGMKEDVRVEIGHLPVEIEQTGFGNFKCHYGGGLETSHLAAELRSDRPGGTG